MITVIVPTWNNVEHLKLTLDSLLKTTQDCLYRVVVVDNASFDGTPDYLASLGEQVTTVRMDHNEGFVRGVNAGLRHVQTGEHVLLLNDDTFILDPLWLKRLATRLVEDVGAVGPVSNFIMGPQKMELNGQYPLLHDVKFLIGFCLLIRADAYRVVGTLDERFLMGGNDDLDYSIRLRRAGFRLAVDRSTFVYHYGARSISRIGGYAKVERETRPLLVEKWGQDVVNELFTPFTQEKVPA